MVARWFIGMCLFNSAMLFINVILKILIGNWSFAIIDLIVGLLSAYFAVIFIKTPAFQFDDGHITVLYRPLLPLKKIMISDIMHYENGYPFIKIYLANQKPLKLITFWLRTSDRMSLASEFRKIINCSDFKIDTEMLTEKVQKSESWF